MADESVASAAVSVITAVRGLSSASCSAGAANVSRISEKSLFRFRSASSCGFYAAVSCAGFRNFSSVEVSLAGESTAMARVSSANVFSLTG